MTLPVDASWTPGQYLVESWDADGLAGITSLVVRDDADRGGLVVVHSNLTWAAYSQYGASSLYKGKDGASDTRAQQTSLQRPVTGAGAGRLVVGDVPLSQFLEEHGIPARHILDTDLDAWPSIATSATALVLPGHSEYWTRRMYDAALAARNAGVNIADLGANEVYWQARLQRDPQGVPLTMTVDRTLAQDPLAATHPDEATVRWSSPPLEPRPLGAHRRAVLGGAGRGAPCRCGRSPAGSAWAPGCAGATCSAGSWPTRPTASGRGRRPRRRTCRPSCWAC